MTTNNYPYPKANPRHRLAALLLDSVLAGLTFYIGWIVWSLIVCGKGQTPGKQILKIRVYDKTTGRPVRWGHMFLRQYLIISSIPFAVFVFFYVVGSIRYWPEALPSPLFFYNGNFGDWYAGYGVGNGSFTFKSYAFYILMLSYLVPVVDVLWIFRGGERNRLVDVIAKTDVLNEAGSQSENQFSGPTTTYAASVGVLSPYGAPSPSQSSSQSSESRITREIREANELFQNGHITQTEYTSLKKKIIASE